MPCVVQQSQHIHIRVRANIAQWSHTLVSYLLGRSISVRYRMNTANIYIIRKESWNNTVMCGIRNIGLGFMKKFCDYEICLGQFAFSIIFICFLIFN